MTLYLQILIIKMKLNFYDHSAYNFLENKFKTGELDIKDKRILGCWL